MEDADLDKQIDEHIDRLIDTKIQEDAASQASPSQPGGASTVSGPALPPQRNKTVDEVLADLNKSPLFMTAGADVGGGVGGIDIGDNVDLEALQALAYEGTPLENALGFKESGNECFVGRKYADAKEFYSKGIMILFAEERKRAPQQQTQQTQQQTQQTQQQTQQTQQTQETKQNKEEEEEEEEGEEKEKEDEIRQEKQTLEAMYVNRAACHLELSNYRSCWTDCAAALRLNPSNVKAYYRSAKALLAVDRIQEADDACARGLELDAQNKALRVLATSIVQRAEFLDRKRRKEEELKAQKARRADLLRTAIAARGIVMEKTQSPPDMQDARVRLAPDEDDPTSELVFPTMLLYPLRMETDFIREFGETHTLGDHLEYILPPPWDEEEGQQVYTPSNVVCYVETKDGGLIKMGKRVPLLKVLAGGKVIVFDQVMRIFVLPADQADSWAKEFKAKRAAEKKT